MKWSYPEFSLLILAIVMFLYSCTPQVSVEHPNVLVDAPSDVSAKATSDVSVKFDAEFTLKTVAENGKLLYIGEGGEIDGIINPDLIVLPGAVVRIVLVNGDGMVHDLLLPDFEAKTDYVKKIGEQAEMVFEVGGMQPGSDIYDCTLPGHRQAGQEGRIAVIQP